MYLQADVKRTRIEIAYLKVKTDEGYIDKICILFKVPSESRTGSRQLYPALSGVLCGEIFVFEWSLSLSLSSFTIKSFLVRKIRGDNPNFRRAIFPGRRSVSSSVSSVFFQFLQRGEATPTLWGCIPPD